MEAARQDFLRAKLTSYKQKLIYLRSLPHQHALLVLRKCLKQNLQHPQRMLKKNDMSEAWDVLDARLWSKVSRSRGRLVVDSREKEDLAKRLFQLPARLGGLGMVPHRACCPHAYLAATETADELFDRLLDVSGLQDRDIADFLRKRCKKMWEEGLEEVMDSMGDV